jgi:uncharacterized membrane protein
MRTSLPTAARVIALALLAAAGAPPALAQTFTGIGQLDGTSTPIGSYANGVSADGSIVVGASYLFDPGFGFTVAHGTRWTPSGGLQDLGHFTLSASVATRTSNDGNTIAGYAGFVTGTGEVEPRNAIYWTNAGAIPQGALISVFPDPVGYISTDVSADGSVIIGQTRAPGPEPVPDQAFRFTQSGGAQILAQPAGYSGPASANAISADGSLIVGYSEGPDALKAWRWTAAGGVQILPGVPTGVPAAAYGVSANGQVIVGDFNTQAMRWTAGGGFQALGLGAFSSTAVDASADGSVIVGNGYFDASQTAPSAFIWDAAHGMRDLRSVLISDFHLGEPTMWTLTEATGISDDGLTIVGNGIDRLGVREGWVVHIPAPGALPLLGAAVLFGLRGRRERKERGPTHPAQALRDSPDQP